jgi:hypothetical protein
MTVSILVLAFSASAVAAGNGPNPNAGQGVYLDPPATTPLTAEEEHWLTYMRKEEKLARDVYLALYDIYGVRVFKNIAASEQRHTNSVKTLLDRYGVADPVADNAPGVFTNPDLQALYNKLVQDGQVSLTEAYKVGVLVEKTDIVDLEEAIAAATHADIDRVYTNLLRGSENHLAAFESNLAR